MDTRHHLWRIRVVLLVTPLLLTMLAPAAQAGPPCPGDTVCLWTGTDFQGDVQVVTPTPGCLGLSAPVLSGFNATGSNVVLYSDSGCGGVVADLGPGEALSAFSSASSLTIG